MKRETTPGMLTHVGRDDLPLDEALSFVATITPKEVHRVFIAGGEPLILRYLSRWIRMMRSTMISGEETRVDKDGAAWCKGYVPWSVFEMSARPQ